MNITDPEFPTLQVVAALAANPSVPLGQDGFCGFRALCLEEEAAAGAVQPHKQDAQDTRQEEHRHRVDLEHLYTAQGIDQSANSQMQTLDFPCHDVGSDRSQSF